MSAQPFFTRSDRVLLPDRLSGLGHDFSDVYYQYTPTKRKIMENKDIQIVVTNSPKLPHFLFYYKV